MIYYSEFNVDELDKDAAASIINKTMNDDTQDEIRSRSLKTEEQIMQDKGFEFWIKQREQRLYGSRSLGKFCWHVLFQSNQA